MQVNQKAERDLHRAILDMASHLLVMDGYKRLSMRKIARAIGYSATSIYLHFKGKDALVHALIEEGMERMYTAFCESAEAHADDPLGRFEAICRGYINFGIENPEYYEIMYLLYPEQMARFPAEKYRRARRNLELFAATLAEGAERGLLEVADPQVAASTVWASLHGAVSLLLSERLDIRIDRSVFVESIIQQTLRSYRMLSVVGENGGR